jgi:hypothetical protein
MIRGRAEGEIPEARAYRRRSADTRRVWARTVAGAVSRDRPRDASRRGFATHSRDRARERA